MHATDSILLVISLYKHILLIGIHDTDALALQEKLFLLPFSLKSKFIHQIRQTKILVIISIHFVIGLHEHVHLIGIHDIDALDLHENFPFTIFI